MTIANRKAEMRREARHRRQETHGETGCEASVGVVDHGLAAIGGIWGTDSPGIAAGYLAQGSELDVGPLMKALESRGWSLVLPVVMAPDTPLVFRRWKSGDGMTDGPLGISEPKDDVAEARPDVVLAPLLAFDDDGYRLGQGGGFYDRTLALWRSEDHPVTVVGLAFSSQRIDAVPRDAYDQRLDGIVTEHGWRSYGDN